MFTAMIPDSENGIVRRVGSASDRRNDAISDVDIDDVDVIDVDGDDGDVESDVDEGRLVAQVTAVNVLSQVQKMQDEIQELNKQIEEENMKVKIKDLKKTMKLTPEGDCHSHFETLQLALFVLTADAFLTVCVNASFRPLVFT